MSIIGITSQNACHQMGKNANTGYLIGIAIFFLLILNTTMKKICLRSQYFGQTGPFFGHFV
jgi:hypothetical protein